MQLLLSQRNQLYLILNEKGLQPTMFEESGGGRYSLTCKAIQRLRFSVTHDDEQYIVHVLPSSSASPNIEEEYKLQHWHSSSYSDVIDVFRQWVESVKLEINAPDLWAESSKALQLFTTADAPAADRFTTAELGAVQGQLRMLSQNFSVSELPEAVKQKLAEIAQAAVLKAEVLTKKDWQFWVTGAFASAVVALELDENHRQEVLALIRLAFGGLFLQA